MEADVKAAFENLTRLIEDNSQSLQREMHIGFDRVEAATGRNTKTLSGGTSALLALHRWAGQRDKLDTRRDREIHDLRSRVQKLERAIKRRSR
jgi:hypothetical protein